jgi:hypothetical protein
MRNLYIINENLKGCDYISGLGIGGNKMLKSVLYGLMGRMYVVQVSQDRVWWWSFWTFGCGEMWHISTPRDYQIHKESSWAMIIDLHEINS